VPIRARGAAQACPAAARVVSYARFCAAHWVRTAAVSGGGIAGKWGMMMVSVEVYGLPHCSTCQRALQYLGERGVTVSRFHDLKAEPLQRSEVEELARKAGGAETLFSRRARKYRQMGLHERDLSEDDLLRLMTEEYTFVTRPVVVRADQAVAGFSQARLDRLVGDGAA
jgi:arsenate reductase (glutaredoxin)